MNIIKTDSRKSLEQNQKHDDFISEVIDRIFLICQEDKNFNETERLDSVEKELTSLQEKVLKQDSLLKQSQEMKRTLKKKSDELNNVIFNEKSQLLESLGSEI